KAAIPAEVEGILRMTKQEAIPFLNVKHLQNPLRRCLFAGLVLLTFRSGALADEQGVDPLRRLEDRIEAVERENALLKRSLLDRSLPPLPTEVTASADIDEIFNNSEDDQRLRSIALDAYRKLDAERRREAAEQQRLADEKSLNDLVMKASWKHGVTLETK